MTLTMRDTTRSLVYAMFAVLFWSTVATAFKIALRGLAVVQLLALAAGSSAVALVVLSVLQGKARTLLRQSRGEWLRSAVLGFLNPFLYYVMLFRAYDLLPAQQAQPLNYTWPLVLSLLAVPLLKVRLRARSLLALVLGLTGVTVIAAGGDPTSLQPSNATGCALAVGSSVIWALFWIFSLRDRRDAVVKLASSFCFGTLYSVALMALCGAWESAAWTAVAVSVYIGLFEMGITFVLWFEALRLSGASPRVANLAYLAPFMSLVLIHLILGERIGPTSVVGLVLIVGGILCQGRSRQGRGAMPD
jgi:drug/metabolite transporter (DMT)-like permease